MTRWRPQRFKREGLAQGVSPTLLDRAIATVEITRKVNPQLPPLFSLRHLAAYTGVHYLILRNLVRREDDTAYRTFRIRKRPAFNGEKRYRTIAVPSSSLMRVQRWINHQILMRADVHSASTAFSPGDNIVEAAAAHCGCKWLIKLDVKDFFESISEISVYRVFRSLGYQPLISFELTRLCTRTNTVARFDSLVRFRKLGDHRSSRWRVNHNNPRSIEVYDQAYMGRLPQGAPTSPMLANLAVREFDATATAIASRYGLTYTRYADDLTFSTNDVFDRTLSRRMISEIYSAMGRIGLSPNRTKTQIRPPGARKIVLGLLVDGPEPRLTRDFKLKMRQHLYFLSRSDIGPILHAQARGFVSVTGLRHHLFGLASYAAQIEPSYGAVCRQALSDIEWPI